MGPPILPRPMKAMMVMVSLAYCVISGHRTSRKSAAGLRTGRGMTPSSIPLRAAHQTARDDHPHDLVGALQDLVDAQIADDLLDAVIGEIAVAAMDLQRLRWRPRSRYRSRPAWPWRRACVASGVLASSAEAARQSRLRAASSSVAMSASLNCSAWKSAMRAAEGLALLRIGQRLVERGLRAAQRAGADIEPPAIQPGHGDLEADPLRARAGWPPARGNSRRSRRASAGRSSPSSSHWRRRTGRACPSRPPCVEMPPGPASPVRTITT